MPDFEPIIWQIVVDDLVFDEKVRKGEVAPAEVKAREAHRADLIAALDDARGTADVTYAQFRKAFDEGAGCQVLYELRNRMHPKDVLKEAANDDLRNVGCDSPRATRQGTGDDDG